MNILDQFRSAFGDHIFKEYILAQITFDAIAPLIISSNAPLVIEKYTDYTRDSIAQTIMKSFTDDALEKMEYKEGMIYFYLKE